MTTPYLTRQRAVATFAFLAPDAGHADRTQPFVVEQVGEHAIAFVVGAASEEAVSQSDIVVALGEPKAPEHIDVIICPEVIEAKTSEAGPLYVGCLSEGKTLGVLALWIGTNGKGYATLHDRISVDRRSR